MSPQMAPTPTGTPSPVVMTAAAAVTLGMDATAEGRG
jgi:hypothetical protein